MVVQAKNFNERSHKQIFSEEAKRPAIKSQAKMPTISQSTSKT